MVEILKKIGIKGLLFLIFSFAFLVIEVYFDLKIPDIMSDITYYIQSGYDEIEKILKSGGKMLGYTVMSIICLYIASMIVARISSNFSARVRKELFYKTQEFSFTEINKFSIPSLITRTTNDIVNVETMLVMGMLVTFKAPIMAGMAIRKIYNKSQIWSMTTAGAVILIAIICIAALIVMYKKFTALQKLTDDVHLIARETINGIYTIRANNFEPNRQKSFNDKNLELTNNNRFTDIIMSFVNTSVNFLMDIVTIVVYFTGAILIDKASNQMEKIGLFSDMVVYSTYALQIINSLLMVIVVFITFPRAMVSAKRVAEILKEKTGISDGDYFVDRTINSIEFKNVGFMYYDANSDVLSDLNFYVKKGETLAITGAIGSGKTTLVNLLMRFYDASEGEILINGVNIKKYSVSDLRSMIGYVPQKNFLFGGTVASNVSYGSEEDEERIEEVCSIACVDEFIENMPDGYQSQVEREGGNFSGGQKQCISIARALYKKASLLIFDDSFSALDYKTDRIIRDKLKSVYKNTIKIIISQRISTILDADKIIVLDEGKISGIGTHESLMKSCENYREFVNVQMTGGGING